MPSWSRSSSSNASRRRPSSASSSVRGPVERVQRVGAARQALSLLQRRPGAGRARSATSSSAAVGERAQPRRRDLLAGRIDRRQVGGGARTVQVVRLDVELVPARAAPRSRTRVPGCELVLQPLLVEPDGRDRAALVRDRRRQDRQPPARASQRDAAHLADDHRLLLAEEVDDAALPDGALVVAGAVLEQVADGARGRASAAAGDPRPDPRERVERLLQPLRPRRPAQARPRLGLVHGCKRRRARHSAEYRCRSGGLSRLAGSRPRTGSRTDRRSTGRSSPARRASTSAR